MDSFVMHFFLFSDSKSFPPEQDHWAVQARIGMASEKSMSYSQLNILLF